MSNSESVYKFPGNLRIQTLGIPLLIFEQWSENESFVERFKFAGGWILIIEWYEGHAYVDSNISLTNYPDESIGPADGFPTNFDFVDRHKPEAH